MTEDYIKVAEPLMAAAAAMEEAAEPNEAAAEREAGEYEIILKKPYLFEGREYSEIDLSKIVELTVKNAIDAQAALFSAGEMTSMILPEMSTAFARRIAAEAAGYPIEFFNFAPIGLSNKVTALVRRFMNSAEKETLRHYVSFEETYIYKGMPYNGIDISGIANMNSLNVSEAENRLVAEGFVSAENSQNFLYACVIASMATGKPEDFFTGLPLIEATKLRTAVNDPDFFE